MTRYFFVAGGTGGHIFPAFAVMQSLAAKGQQVTFVTDRRGGRFCQDMSYHTVAAEAVVGRGMLRQLKALLVMGYGYVQSHFLLWRLKPDKVVGFGGYAALPLVLAAQHQGRWTAIHEQNAIMGRVNRLLARRAKQVFLSFSMTQKVPDHVPSLAVGNPLRQANSAEQTFREHDKLELLVLGGSLGASIFDQVVPDALELLSRDQREAIRVRQQVATIAPANMQARYTKMGIEAECAKFIDNAAGVMLGANLLISRAGGGITTEAALANLPTIYVPLPIAADDHQWFNAEFYAKQGAALNIRQHDFTPELLADKISGFLHQPERLQQMRETMTNCAKPDALETMINHLDNHDQTA